MIQLESRRLPDGSFCVVYAGGDGRGLLVVGTASQGFDSPTQALACWQTMHVNDEAQRIIEGVQRER
jgi:hypothetical protein